MGKSRILPHLALLAVALIYGANYLIAKSVMNDGYIQPFGFILLRVIFGVVALSAFHALFIKERIERKDLMYLGLCALTGVAGNMLAFFKGLELTSTIHASIIMTITPISVLIFSYLILKESLTRKKIFGVCLGFLGALWLILSTQGGSDTVSSLQGDLYILFNALSFSMYLVLVRKMNKKYNTFTVVKWAFLLALPIVVPFGYQDVSEIKWDTFTTPIWIALAYVLVATTFLAYLFNAFALSRLQASTVGIYIYLQPIIASTLAVLFSTEVFGLIHLFSGMLIFAGVYFVSSKKFSS